MRVTHSKLPYWLSMPDADFAALKKAVTANGVNSRGWRMYADFGDAVFEYLADSRLFSEAMRLENAMALLKLLAACEMDVLPPPELLASMAEWRLPDERIEVIPASFMRTLWKRCVQLQYVPKRQNVLAIELAESIIPTARWYFATEQYLKTKSQRQTATWETLQAHCRDWVVNELVDSAERMHNDSRCVLSRHGKPLPNNVVHAQWPLFVPRVEHAGLRFLALGNGAELVAEGERMQHCVGSYAEACRQRMLRIYTVLDINTGKRLATLSVKETQPGSWVMDELKGFQNCDPLTHVVVAADAVLRALHDAWQIPESRQEMDVFRASCLPPEQVSLADFDDDIHEPFF